MAEYSIDKYTFNGNTYKFVDKVSGYVNKSGDTMTGNLTFDYTSGGASSKSIEFKYGSGSPSSVKFNINGSSSSGGTVTNFIGGFSTPVRLGGIATPNNNDDAATKKYVDDSIPTVPTNVSAFNNDAGYLTAHQTIPVTDVTLNGSSIVSSGIAAITNANGDLGINGSLTTGDSICIPNNNRYQTKTTTDITRNMIGLYTNNNLIIGSAAQREDYNSSTGYGGNTIIYGRAVHFYTGTSSSSDLDALWIQADGAILVNLDSTNDADLWAALNTAGWRTSPVVVP